MFEFKSYPDIFRALHSNIHGTLGSTLIHEISRVNWNEKKKNIKMIGFEIHLQLLSDDAQWSTKFIRIPNSVWRKLDHLHFLKSLDGKLVCSLVGLALISCLILHTHKHIHCCQLTEKRDLHLQLHNICWREEKEQKTMIQATGQIKQKAKTVWMYGNTCMQCSDARQQPLLQIILSGVIDDSLQSSLDGKWYW